MQTARRVNPNLAEPLLVNDNVFAPATVTRKRRAAPAIGNNAVKQATPWRIWLMSAPPENHRPRRAGSARFDTYYKVQYWDPRNCAWADIQKQHPTVGGGRGRLYRRAPMPHDGGDRGGPPGR